MGNYGSVGNTVYEVGICRHPMVGPSGAASEDSEGALEGPRGVKKVGDARDCFHRGAKVIRRFSYNGGFLVRNAHGYVKRLGEDEYVGEHKCCYTSKTGRISGSLFHSR